MRDAVAIAIELHFETLVNKCLDGVAVIIRDPPAAGVGAEAMGGSLPGLMMEALAGYLGQPLSRLAVYIVQVGKLAHGQKF